MTLTAAGFALFLDVSDFPAGRHLAIPADHAAASERSEAEKPNETHRILRLNREQYTYRDPPSPLRAYGVAGFASTTWKARLSVRSTHIGTGREEYVRDRRQLVTPDL